MSFLPNTCKPCRLHDRDQVLASASWEAVPENLRRSGGARPGPSALSNQSEGYKSPRCQASNMCFTASSRRRLTLRSFRDKLMVVDLLVIDLVLSSSSKAFFLHDLNQRNYEKLCTVNWKSIYIKHHQANEVLSSTNQRCSEGAKKCKNVEVLTVLMS